MPSKKERAVTFKVTKHLGAYKSRLAMTKTPLTTPGDGGHTLIKFSVRLFSSAPDYGPIEIKQLEP